MYHIPWEARCLISFLYKLYVYVYVQIYACDKMGLYVYIGGEF